MICSNKVEIDFPVSRSGRYVISGHTDGELCPRLLTKYKHESRFATGDLS